MSFVNVNTHGQKRAISSAVAATTAAAACIVTRRRQQERDDVGKEGCILPPSQKLHQLFLSGKMFFLPLSRNELLSCAALVSASAATAPAASVAAAAIFAAAFYIGVMILVQSVMPARRVELSYYNRLQVVPHVA